MFEGKADSGQHHRSASGNILYRLAKRSRAFLLLLALLGTLATGGFSGEFQTLSLVLRIWVIFSAMFMAADCRRHLVIGLAFGIPGIVLTIIADLTRKLTDIKYDTLDWIAFALILGLFFHIIRLMLEQIFTAKRVTLDTIGLALCTYILLGYLWVLFYIPVVELDPDAFSVAFEPESTGNSLRYFSYVTLTTLGYGDISPVSPIARTLAILEALTGTLFLAVLISRLVGSYRSQRDKVE